MTDSSEAPFIASPHCVSFGAPFTAILANSHPLPSVLILFSLINVLCGTI